MKYLYIFFLSLVNITSASIHLRILSGRDGKIHVKHSGIGFKTITEANLDIFRLSFGEIRRAVKSLYSEPDHIFLAESVPWGKIHEIYCWEPLTLVTTVKNATITKIESEPVTLATHDFDNDCNDTIKASASLTQAVENVVSTKWSSNHGVALHLGAEFKFEYLNFQQKSLFGFSESLTLGKEEEKSTLDHAKTSANVEVPVRPKQSIVAVLEGTKGSIEVTVVYEATIRGNLAISFKDKFQGHYYWAIPFENLCTHYGLENRATTVGVINMAFYTNIHTKVYDKATGMLL